MSESYRQHFVIEDTDYGSSPREPEYRDGRTWAPLGYAFFCPLCTKLWATAVVSGQRTMVLTALCRNHPWTALETPGSLLHPFNQAFNAALPDGAVIRENLLWIDNDTYFKQYLASTEQQSSADAADAAAQCPEDPPHRSDGDREDALPSHLP